MESYNIIPTHYSYFPMNEILAHLIYHNVSKFIHVEYIIRISFLVRMNNIPLYDCKAFLFIHSFTYEHFAIVNNVVMSVRSLRPCLGSLG
jgi:hypothetical protein